MSMISSQTCMVTAALLILTWAPVQGGEPPKIMTVSRYGLSSKAVASSQQQWAKFLNLERFRKNRFGMTMVLIPPGEFDLGIRESQEPEIRNKHEFFVTRERGYRVRLSRPFWISAHEVSKIQYNAVFPERSWHSNSELPVFVATFYDAIEFCNRLSKLSEMDPYYALEDIDRHSDRRFIEKADVKILGGTGYRLPTDAEWEFACRAGTVTHYSFGNSCNGSEAHIARREPFGTEKILDSDALTAFPKKVGSFSENAFGLFDMHGNVKELVDKEWVEERIFNAGVEVDPHLPHTSEGQQVTLRGGGYLLPAFCARSSARRSCKPGDPESNGFRVVRSIE